MSDEQMWRVAHHMRESAERAERAADRMEQVAQRMAVLLEDGYGGNALRLIELLELTETIQSGPTEVDPHEEKTAAQLRAEGRPYCPACYTFGHSHRKNCRYKDSGTINHIKDA